MLIPIIQPPSDGFMDFEKLFLKDTLISIYKILGDARTKFIMVAYFECGYNQQQIADMLKISQVAVQKRIKKAQDKLRKDNIFKDLL
jgi:RNA polymerase sigma factor (sigma-70 family)